MQNKPANIRGKRLVWNDDLELVLLQIVRPCFEHVLNLGSLGSSLLLNPIESLDQGSRVKKHEGVGAQSQKCSHSGLVDFLALV